jgi:hypothetical protein
MKLHTLEEAKTYIQEHLNVLLDNGFQLQPIIKAQGDKAIADISLQPMTAQEHKQYLEEKKAKPKKDEA